MTLKNTLAALCLLLFSHGISFAVDPIDIRPPTNNPTDAVQYKSALIIAQIIQTSDTVELVFLTATASVLVEVYDANGTCVFAQKGSVEAYRSLIIDACGWKGSYTVSVKTPYSQEQHRVSY